MHADQVAKFHGDQPKELGDPVAKYRSTQCSGTILFITRHTVSHGARGCRYRLVLSGRYTTLNVPNDRQLLL